MKVIDDIYTNKLRRYTNDYYHRKISENLINFISCKNKLKFESDFDRKGAKKFLNEKAKAMEEIVLDDSTDDSNKNTSNDDNSQNIDSHDKYSHQNENIKRHKSHKSLLNNIKINKHSNKKNNILKEKDKYMSSHTIFLIGNFKDIGKIKSKKNKKEVFLGPIKKNDEYNNTNSDDDSFIDSIIHHMDEKN